MGARLRTTRAGCARESGARESGAHAHGARAWCVRAHSRCASARRATRATLAPVAPPRAPSLPRLPLPCVLCSTRACAVATRSAAALAGRTVSVGGVDVGARIQQELDELEIAAGQPGVSKSRDWRRRLTPRHRTSPHSELWVWALLLSEPGGLSEEPELLPTAGHVRLAGPRVV